MVVLLFYPNSISHSILTTLLLFLLSCRDGWDPYRYDAGKLLEKKVVPCKYYTQHARNIVNKQYMYNLCWALTSASFHQLLTKSPWAQKAFSSFFYCVPFLFPWENKTSLHTNSTPLQHHNLWSQHNQSVYLLFLWRHSVLSKPEIVVLTP